MAPSQQRGQLPGLAPAQLLVKRLKQPKDSAHLSLDAQQALILVQQLPLSRFGPNGLVLGTAQVAQMHQAGCCCC